MFTLYYKYAFSILNTIFERTEEVLKLRRIGM